MTSSLKKADKELSLYMFLSCLFITNALVAEVIGVKVFSLEKLLGIHDLNLPFINGTFLSMNMSVGIIIWPIVFILTDIVNEYFGREGVRRMSILGAVLIGYAFLVIYSGTKLPPSDMWLNNNSTDLAGRPFNIDFAYSSIFRQGLGIIVGSLTAFLVGQFIDMHAFHYIRVLTNHKMLWLRSTGSTIISQIVDSYLILIIAFYWLGNWSLMQVLAIGTIQYIYKISVAIILTPVIYWMHGIIDRYLGREDAHAILEKAIEK